MVAFSWLWIPITVFAAFVQNIRSAAQKHLTSELNTISVTMVRFLFGLPFGLLYLWFLNTRRTETFPDIGWNFFAIASLTMRKATLMLGMEDFLFRAALTMIFMLTMQTVAMCLFVLVTNPAQYLIVWRNFKVCLLVGVTSVMGTIGWATAFTLEQAAYVKSLAQVEFVFTLAASYWFFKERSSPKELCGIALVVLGIILLVLFG